MEDLFGLDLFNTSQPAVRESNRERNVDTFAKDKKEKEKKDRQRMEQAMEKREKDKKRADALRQLEIWSEHDNLLKRPSDFMCKMKFFNTLPDPPSEPRMLRVSLPLERFAEYRATSLQREYRHDMLLLSPDMGIPVDLVDPQQYVLPSVNATLHPDDAALVAPEKEVALANASSEGSQSAAASAAGGGARRGGAAAGGKKMLAGAVAAGPRKKQPLHVPWLRRSEFITSVFDENLYNQGGREEIATIKDAQETPLVDKHLVVVMKSFEQANSSRPITHPSNPGLKPVSVQHVFPNEDYLANNLQHVLCENVPAVLEDAEKERRTAILLPHVLGKDRAAYVRIVPKPTGKRGREGGDVEDKELDELFGDGEEEEEKKAQQAPSVEDDPFGVHEYAKTNEYSFRVKGKTAMAGKYLLLYGGPYQHATYVPLEVRLELFDLSHDIRGVNQTIPSRYKIQKREMNAAEIEHGVERFHNLFGEEYEYADEVEGDQARGGGNGGGGGSSSVNAEEMDLAAELATSGGSDVNANDEY